MNFICPICWRIYAANEIQPKWPKCPDCESEVIGVDVAPFDEFVCSRSDEEMLEALRTWKRATNIREDFQKRIIQRIRSVLKVKRAEAMRLTQTDPLPRIS
jgi:hypothetical protein